MAKLGRGDDAGETTLAAATAAIITARWGAPSRAGRVGDDFAAASGRAPASPAPVSPIPMITIPESSVPFSPFTPVSPAGGPVSPAPQATSAPPVPPVERVGGRASVSPDHRMPPPPLADGGYGVFTDHSYGPDGHGPNGFADPGLSGRTPGGTLGGDGYDPAEARLPADGAIGPDGFKAFAPIAPDPAPEVAGPPAKLAPGGPDAASALQERYRGAASPPPMFKPATSIQVPEVFEGRTPPVPGSGPPMAATEPLHQYLADPYAPPAPVPPPVHEPPTLTTSPYPREAAPAPAASEEFDAFGGPAPSGGGSGLLAAASAGAAALLSSGVGRARVPVPGSPPGPDGPSAGPRAASAGPKAAGHDEFAGSVMSGMTLPKPFVAEPYDPGAFSLPEYSQDVRPDRGRVRESELVGAGARATGGAPAPAVRPLPKRVPSIPDVPDQFLPNDPAADGFELTKIASFFRDGRIDATDDRPDGFDVTAVLQAVRSVPGVKEAQLRWNTGYGHTLRVEFVPGADEGEVTREVARMLRETMGLTAQPGLIGPGGPGGIPNARLSPEESTLERNRRAATSGGTRAVRPAGPGPARVVLDHVQVTTLGTESTVDVRLAVSGGQFSGATAKGARQGPAVDAYLLRLAADATADAVDHLLLDPTAGTPRARCVVEHAAIVPFGAVEVAVVIGLVMTGSEATKVAGSAIVAGDPRHAVVRATLSAVNRRLEELLS